jgi:hypothetical protein
MSDSSSGSTDIGTKLDAIFSSYIGRIVAFGLAPVLALAAPPIVEALNNVLGTDYTSQQVSNIAIATVVGVAAVIWQWLRNRGDWEKELAKLHIGNQIIDQIPIPPAPAHEEPIPEAPASSALGMTEPPPQS